MSPKIIMTKNLQYDDDDNGTEIAIFNILF